MLRLCLVVFGWPLLLLALVLAFGWVKREFIDTIREPPNTASIQHPSYHQIGVRAAAQYAALAREHQAAVRTSLASNLHTPAEWVERLDQDDYELLCIGEDHRDSTRTFLARAVFDRLPVDVFLLEATGDGVDGIKRRMADGKAYVPMLDADIAAVVNAVRRRNPTVVLAGIEETRTQRRRRQGLEVTGFRDDSIARNLWLHFVPGQRNVILFGALHCTERPNWLYATVRDTAPVSLGKMRNVRVVGEHQDGPLEAFVFFLDEIGLAKGDFVIQDADRLHPLVYAWFPLLNQQIFTQYKSVVVFR